MTLTIVEASNVGVNVGMGGRGVGGRGVLVDSFAHSRGVLEGKGEDVALGRVFVPVAETKVAGISPAEACPHAVRIKIPLSSPVNIFFNAFLLVINVVSF